MDTDVKELQSNNTNGLINYEIFSSPNEMDLLDNSFLPQEMLLEEKRLYEENELKENEVAKMDTLDEEQRERRYKNLLTLLENSNKLTNVFENRLKKCKQQIIKKELRQANKMKETASNKNTQENSNSLNKEMNEEEYYLSLFKQPKMFKGVLKPHQIEGLLWIRTLFENGLNGILADDMGLGKTIQTIAFYCFLIEMGIKGPFLVIAPLSTIPNWLSEFSKFAPDLPTLLYHGSEVERIALRSKFSKSCKINNLSFLPIIITTYEIIRFDVKFLSAIDWKYITIDEGHKFKNYNSLISKCMRQFDCTNKLILTGTPIQNDMTELWSLLNLLMPKLFNQLEDFNSWFTIETFFDSNIKIACMAKKNHLLDIIHKVLKPFILRREKKETDLNLPPKKEVVIYAPVTETQKELYIATLNNHLDVLLNQKNETDLIINGIRPKRKCVERIERYTELNAIMFDKEPEVETGSMAFSLTMQHPMCQLLKIANHPYLVQMPLIMGSNRILVNESIVKVSGKFQVLDAMLAKLKLRGHKVLLFSTMTQLLDIIEEFLVFRSYKYTRLDGTMKIQSRVDAMNTFNKDQDCFIMIISTRAGGLGLNLTSADTVILFNSDWNPQVDLQAQDRCHRMGQEKPVVVYRFCSKNTLDEKILERATAKRKLEKMIIGNGTFNRNTKFTPAGLEELMKLLELSEYSKKIQSNGFIFTDEELDALLDRSDMVETSIKTNVPQTANHFEVVDTNF